MRWPRQSALVFCLTMLSLAGCAAVQVSQDYDPSAVPHRQQTWQWMESSQSASGDLRVDNPLLNKRIRQAIDRHLTGRNIRHAQHPPDLYVSYHLTIQPKLKSYSSYSSLGMGAYYHPWYWGYNTDTHIYQYDECQLNIDIHGADAQALLWRGTGVYRYQTYKTPDAAAADMQKTVDRILAQFPPQEK